ncbi:MAG TPA: HD domain-containing protein, partial [Vulgatibacter sp.]
MDKVWVKDIQTGQRAAGVFAVARKQQASGKNGKPFLKVLLQDKTGQLDARVWNQADELSALFEAGDRVRVEGPVASFQGRPQLTIESLEKSLEDRDPADFAFEAPPEVREPKAAGGEASLGALRSELSKVSDPHVKALLFSFLDDPEVASRLRRAPAAKEIHHAYPGGLLDHILSCVRLASKLADHYPMADHDLLLAGAFLHDLGKISELSYDKGITTYTDEGKLVGHLVMTATWIKERAAAIPGFPKDLEHHLVHLVLAHHGRLEYGSPKLPMTIEAFLVHELDEIDSRIDAMLGQMARSPGKKWTDPQKTHERMLWKAPAPTEAGRRK